MEHYAAWFKRTTSIFVIGLIVGCASNMQKGQQAEQSGDYQAMLEYCTKATKEKNSPAQAFKCIGDAHIRLGNKNAAEAAYITYLERVPDDSKVRLRLAKLYFDAGDYSLAQIQLEKILETDTSNYESYYLLGEIHRLMDHCKSAKGAYNQSLMINPGYIKAKLGLEKLSKVCESKKVQISPEKKKEETLRGGGKALRENQW